MNAARRQKSGCEEDAELQTKTDKMTSLNLL